MIWKPGSEKPDKVGYYFVWHPLYGRMVMGWNDGWGATNPEWWLSGDQCPAQERWGTLEKTRIP